MNLKQRIYRTEHDTSSYISTHAHIKYTIFHLLLNTCTTEPCTESMRGTNTTDTSKSAYNFINYKRLLATYTFLVISLIMMERVIICLHVGEDAVTKIWRFDVSRITDYTRKSVEEDLIRLFPDIATVPYYSYVAIDSTT